jgi:hypothetical protein
MRRVLVALLGLGMAVLSFDALRAYALTGRPLTDGVIPQATILPRPWLAMLWAVMVDLAAAAGILGVKDDRRDWRAWLMLLLALAATLGFQVFAAPPVLARAVPPVGLALAILVLDLGPGRPKPERTSDPAPARLHAWLGSWNDQAPVARDGPPPGPPDHPDLEELVAQQADLDARIEAERVQLEERWEDARLLTQVSSARHRAVAVGTPVVDFSLSDWKALLEQHGHRCAYCGVEGMLLLIEHRTPLSRGGDHTSANIVPACESCNLSKGAKTEAEWREVKDAREAVAQERGATVAEPIRRTMRAAPGQRTTLTEDQRAEVARRIALGHSALSISTDLGLSQRGYKHVLLPLVRDLKVAQLRNGDGGP